MKVYKWFGLVLRPRNQTGPMALYTNWLLGHVTFQFWSPTLRLQARLTCGQSYQLMKYKVRDVHEHDILNHANGVDSYNWTMQEDSC